MAHGHFTVWVHSWGEAVEGRHARPGRIDPGACPVSWYPRSMGDRDTHRGQYSITTRSVHSVCGAEFVPLKLTDGSPLVLPGSPPDPDQICPQCRHASGTP
jgi:hypothetical protein